MRWDYVGFVRPGNEWNRLAPAALRAKRIRGAIGVGVALVVVLAALGGILLVDAIPPALSAVPLLLGAAAVGIWLWWTAKTFRAVGWLVDANTVQLTYGVWRQVWQGVARDRIQFVEVGADPIQRALGLSTVTVRTAGFRTPAVTIVDLETNVAEGLRVELNPAQVAAPELPPLDANDPFDAQPGAEPATGG